MISDRRTNGGAQKNDALIDRRVALGATTEVRTGAFRGVRFAGPRCNVWLL